MALLLKVEIEVPFAIAASYILKEWMITIIQEFSLAQPFVLSDDVFGVLIHAGFCDGRSVSN